MLDVRSMLRLAGSVVLLSLLAMAQSFTGRITGVVADPTGSVIPGASVRFVNTDTNSEWTAQTNDRGEFVTPDLPRGNYNMLVTHSGFKSFSRTGIVIQVNQQSRVDVTLDVGETSETVEVRADISQLETESAAVGKVVDNRRIMDLPLNTRNVFSLIYLTPGVAGSISTDYGTGYSINGVRASLLEVMVDGISTAHPTVQGYSGNSNFPPVDAIAEFKIQASNYSAEYGRSLGGITNVVYKSGTNQLHGSAFEFLRNSVLDANNFFDNRIGRDLGSFKRSQFGGHVTGPIIRDRTFFLFSYEGLRQRAFSRENYTVPTSLQRAGDFSNTRTANGNLISIYDPFTTGPNPGGTGSVRTPFANNRIPTARFDAVASNLLRYFPQANTAGDPVTEQNNYQQSGSSKFDTDQWDTRVDHNLTQTRRVFGRYSYRKPVNAPAILFPSDIAVAEGRINPTTIQHTAVADYTDTLSASTVLNLRMGFSRSLYIHDNQGLGFLPSSLGLNSAIDGAVDRHMFPRISMSDVVSLGGGDHRYNAFMTYSALGYLTKIVGSHTMKFGYDARIIRVNVWEARAAGTFNFTRRMTQGPNPTTASANSGHGFASLLLGAGTDGSLLQNWKNVASQSFYHAMYFQDDWRVSRTLTLNLGLRWEYETPRTERYDRMNWFDPSVPNPLANQVSGFPNLAGGLQFVNVGENARSQYDHDYNNIAPRFGFAWQLLPKTVLRGGFGLFFAPSPQTAHGTVGPFGFRVENLWLASLDSVTPNQTLTNAFSEGFRPVPGSSEGLLTATGGRVEAVLRNTVVPYTSQWNLSLQQELPGDFLFEAGYIGNRGFQLMRSAEGQMTLNQLPTSAMAMGSQLNTLVDNPFYGVVNQGVLSQPRVTVGQLMRPYPQFTDIIPLYWGGSSSNYHSLQTTMKKRLSAGLLLEGSYVWSKTIEEPLTQHQDSYNLRASRGLAPIDIPHRFVLSAVYELPIGKGRKFLTDASRFTDAVLGGWQINTITTYQSGTPLQLSANNTSGLFAMRTLPNNNGTSGKKSGRVQDRLDSYFDQSVFSQPAAFTLGNHALYSPDIRSDSTRNWDISLFKQFRITEKINAQFRAEAFNAFNRVQFGNPNLSVTSSAFGVVASQANTPRQIQFGLKFLW